MMIYLFGIWHDYQCYGEGNDDNADLLKDAIENAITDNSITVLAEEFNKDSFNDSENSKTVLQVINEDDDTLKHVFCEMSARKRLENEIYSRLGIRHRMFMNDEEPAEDAVKEEERSYYPLRKAH
jgi:hypothetical protein